MRRLLAVVGAVVLGVTACSSDQGNSTPLTDKFGLTQAGATSALLGVNQVASGLSVKAGDQTQTPQPCTPKAAPISQQFHPRAAARVSFTDDLGTFEVTEIITNYAGKATAIAAANTLSAGLKCTDAFIGRFAVAIAGPQSLTALGTPVDGAALWSIKSSVAEQSVIVVRLGSQLIQLVFGATGAVRAQVDPAGIAKAAVAKVQSTIKS